MKRKSVGLLCLLSLAIGASRESQAGEKKVGPNAVGDASKSPLRIGLFADSHLQTTKGEGSVGLLRGRFGDSFVDVALRPVALERLSPALLQALLARAVDESKVDLIVYLGDGANNGCKDEFEQALGILAEIRDGSGTREKKTAVPVFVLVGNHDYLGAGNTPKKRTRQRLCSASGNDNPPLSKQEVLQQVHEFNTKNRLPTSWRYQDSWGTRFGNNCAMTKDGNLRVDTHGQSLVSYLLGRLVPGQAAERTGCFLASRLIVDSRELLMFDTSDYMDKVARPGVGTTEFYGTMGWISTSGDSQLEWLKTARDQAPIDGGPSTRILLSHYPPKDFGMSRKAKRPLSRFGEVWTPGPRTGKTAWLSAHTHDPIERGVLRRSVPAPIDLLNVGSTTDYLPQGAIAEFAADGTLKASLVLPDLRLMTAILEKLKVEEVSVAYDRVGAVMNKDAAFGLGREYRDKLWNRAQSEAAGKNLDKLVDSLKKLLPSIPEATIRSGLAVESSRREDGEDAKGAEQALEREHKAELCQSIPSVCQQAAK